MTSSFKFTSQSMYLVISLISIVNLILTEALSQDGMLAKLDCKPAEKRTFAYESDTKLWGSIDENFVISADIQIHCMGFAGPKYDKIGQNGALKYLVQIEKLQPKIIQEKKNEILHMRLRRAGISEWMTEAWEKVKDFFAGLFSQRRRSRNKSPNFDIDDEPAESGSKDDYQCRSDKKDILRRRKRETAEDIKFAQAISQIYNKMFDVPFEFIQLPDGSIPEVRFSDRDKDETVKNFKRHIVDTFKTQLRPDRQENAEHVGQSSNNKKHSTRYTFDDIGNLVNRSHMIDEASSGQPQGNLQIAGGSLSYSSSLSFDVDSKPIAIIRDISKEAMMQFGNGMVYDPSQIDISAKQVQQISQGRLTSTAGHMSLSLVSTTNKKDNTKGNLRNKRATNDEQNHPDLNEYMKVRNKYSLTMTKAIIKRSIQDDNESLRKLKELEATLNFKGESLLPQTTPETSQRESLTALRDSLSQMLDGENTEVDQIFYQNNKEGNPIYDTMVKILDLESELNESNKDDSLTMLIKLTINEDKGIKIEKECGMNGNGNLVDYKKCHDIFLILIKAQSRKALEKLLSTLDATKDIVGKNQILTLLVQTKRPDDWIIKELIMRENEISRKTTSRSDQENLTRKSNDESFQGSLLLAISNLASHSSSRAIKNQVAEILIHKISMTKCSKEDTLTIDSLEALGNLGAEQSIDHVIKVADKCVHSGSYQIASLHAIRKIINHEMVQIWLMKLMNDGKRSCSVKQEIVSLMKEAIDQTAFNVQPIKSKPWPKYGFNSLDQLIVDTVLTKQNHECLRESLVEYLGRKIDEQAKAELMKVQRHARRRRAVHDSFWENSQCKEITPEIKGSSDEGKKDFSEHDEGHDDEGLTVVSSGNQERQRLREIESTSGGQSSSPYRKRRKCSASKRFGPKNAEAIFRADIINDLSGTQEKPEYKLLAKFALGTNFLGKDVDVGKLYIYHRKDSSRAYVNLFGNTLVDAAHDNCDGRENKPYIYSQYFPLYDFNIWIVHMTMGIRLTAEMKFDLPRSNCGPNKASLENKLVDITPEAKLRASGEASGKVLVMRGGIDVGGNFNYFSNLKFSPQPELCLTAINGYKPMNVSIASWYQFWHPGCSEWMERSGWSPLSLNWQLSQPHRSPWIEDECLIKSGDKRSGGVKVDP